MCQPGKSHTWEIRSVQVVTVIWCKCITAGIAHKRDLLQPRHGIELRLMNCIEYICLLMLQFGKNERLSSTSAFNLFTVVLLLCLVNTGDLHLFLNRNWSHFWFLDCKFHAWSIRKKETWNHSQRRAEYWLQPNSILLAEDCYIFKRKWYGVNLSSDIEHADGKVSLGGFIFLHISLINTF